ncbi:hypothetical protein V9T40_000319 [Parthenolecanium corni]|uniref:Uncharacterized protein n=1 Tax=Parthenolecanium corni TaxID=536013 RepID=A0AAN9T9K8_9HEMI
MVGEKVRLWHTSSVCGNTTSDHRKIRTTTVAELSPTVGSATIGQYFLTMSESDFRLWHNLVRQSDLPQSEIIFVHVGVRLWHNLVRQSDLPQSEIIFVHDPTVVEFYATVACRLRLSHVWVPQQDPTVAEFYATVACIPPHWMCDHRIGKSDNRTYDMYTYKSYNQSSDMLYYECDTRTSDSNCDGFSKDTFDFRGSTRSSTPAGPRYARKLAITGPKTSFDPFLNSTLD